MTAPLRACSWRDRSRSGTRQHYIWIFGLGVAVYPSGGAAMVSERPSPQPFSCQHQHACITDRRDTSHLWLARRKGRDAADVRPDVQGPRAIASDVSPAAVRYGNGVQAVADPAAAS